MSNPSRDHIYGVLREAGISKPDSCEKCDKKPEPKFIWPLVELDRPQDVVWLCVSCYRAAKPSKRKSTGREWCRKGPPYEVMKADYLAGMTFVEMAAKYGVTQRSGVYCTLKARAMRRGEWPLRRNIQVNVIWDLVRHTMRTKNKSRPVWVAMNQANRWAPTCGVSGKREFWPRLNPPHYHVPECPFIRRRPDGQLVKREKRLLRWDPSVFTLSVEEAEDWGYQPCAVCIDGMLKDFAREHGFSRDVLERIDRGERPIVPFKLAAALLRAIGEPIAESLHQPARSHSSATATTHHG